MFNSRRSFTEGSQVFKLKIAQNHVINVTAKRFAVSNTPRLHSTQLEECRLFDIETIYLFKLMFTSGFQRGHWRKIKMFIENDTITTIVFWSGKAFIVQSNITWFKTTPGALSDYSNVFFSTTNAY
ncbi:hypothetical protein CAEBREN_25114 [Caenorhabditis brenneri]|uniref:Uncharacterized protein n=1 Tax=Caenorhabditis brenneri TaxID=135651 RepID=G0MH61_CAEBE|nr:hypothetical protein CAEBREN_25114 [Caenorhabditis brenneri]